MLSFCSLCCMSLGGLAGMTGIAVHTPGRFHSPADGFALILAALAFFTVGSVVGVIHLCMRAIPDEQKVTVLKWALDKLPDPLALLKLPGGKKDEGDDKKGG